VSPLPHRAAKFAAALVAALLFLGDALAACSFDDDRKNDRKNDQNDDRDDENDDSHGEHNDGAGEGEGEPPPTGVDIALATSAGELEAALQRSVWRAFAIDDCEVMAGCAVAGPRALLSFPVALTNRGTVASSATTMTQACGIDIAPGLLTARLVDRTGAVALEVDLDTNAVPSIAPGDRIDVTLEGCGSVDITDVPPGDYTFELSIDSVRLGGDDDDTNDVARAPIVVVAGLRCEASASVCAGVCCPSGVACDESDGGCQLPDLSVDEEALRTTAVVEEQSFSAESCAIVEGCVDAPGGRRLVRFSTTTPNHGNADLVMGRPRDRPELFSFSDCHGHFHFDQYADYRLLGADGRVAATGHKQAFCLIDLERRENDARLVGQFGCSTDGTVPQGISQGWADTYGSHLDCQWIDITGVPEGDYVLEVHVNPRRIFRELDFMNNVARVPVHVPADPSRCQPNAAGELCHNGRDDDCDDTVDEDCAPVTTADSCDNGYSVDGPALITGEIAADDDSDIEPSCGGRGGEFVVHFNTAAANAVYLSTYGSTIDTTLSIYPGATCNPADEVFCSDDGCGDVGGGGAHYLGVPGDGAWTAVVKAKTAGEGGRVQLKILHSGCGDARLLALPGDDASVTSDVQAEGVRDQTTPTCLGGCGTGARDELWYFATCPGAQRVSLTTCGPGVAEGEVPPDRDATRFDTLLEVRDGNCLGSAVDGTCNDDAVPGSILCSLVDTTLEGTGAGDGLWFVLVDGCGAIDTAQGSRGSYELHLDVDTL
jgi:hypothetical protein